MAATGQPCPSGPSGTWAGDAYAPGASQRCERSPRGGDGRGGGGAAGTRVSTAGGGGGARGFKKVWRGRELSQARPRGVAHTQAAALGGGRHRSPRPWLRPRAPLSLLRPKVTSGAAVSRQLPPRARLPGAARLEPAAGSPSLRVAPKLNERARGARGGTERGGMERSCWAPRTLVLAILLLATLRARAATGYYPRFSPFFFLCTHHGELEGDGEQGEVLISLHIAGNPTYYVPGQEYHGRYHGIPMRHGGPRTYLSILFLLPRG